MSRMLIVIAATAAALAGCNRGATQNNAAGAPPVNTSAADAPMPNATLPAGQPVDQAFVARTWGMGSCDRTMTFHADGTLTNTGDTEVAHWTLSGATLTILPPGEAPEPSPVVRQGDNLLMGDGPQLMTFVPCPATPAGAPAGGENKAGKADEKE